MGRGLALEWGTHEGADEGAGMLFTAFVITAVFCTRGSIIFSNAAFSSSPARLVPASIPSNTGCNSATNSLMIFCRNSRGMSSIVYGRTLRGAAECALLAASARIWLLSVSTRFALSCCFCSAATIWASSYMGYVSKSERVNKTNTYFAVHPVKLCRLLL